MRAIHAGANPALRQLLAVAALLLYGGSSSVLAEPAAGPQGKATTASTRPDLTGVRVLNQKLSEDPRQKLDEAHRKGSGDPGRRGGRGGRQSMSGDGIRSGGGPGKRNEGLGGLRSLWDAPRKLSLSHQDPLLEMGIDDRRTRTLYTDNRGASVSASGGMQQRVSTAGWEKGTLVVETTTDAGPQVVERYRLSEGEQRLLVTRELMTLQISEPVIVETAYDRQPPQGDVE